MDALFTPFSLALRLWILTTGAAGFGAAIGAYLKPLSPHKTLYTRSPTTAHPAFARMYATWLLTSTTVRVTYFLHPPATIASPLFTLAFGTYVIALWHFGLEIFHFKTAGIRPGGIGPLIVASGTILWMGLIVYNNM